MYSYSHIKESVERHRQREKEQKGNKKFLKKNPLACSERLVKFTLYVQTTIKTNYPKSSPSVLSFLPFSSCRIVTKSRREKL